MPHKQRNYDFKFENFLSDFCHNLAYKQLIAEHLNDDSFLTFEFKGNRIASFDSVQQPCLSIETETLVRTPLILNISK